MLTKHILLLFALSVPLTIFIDVGGATPEETTQSNTNNLACPTGTQQYIVNNPNFNKAQYIVTFGLTGDYITFFTFSGPSGTIGSWKATTPIKEIIMKGGKSGATVYTFDTGTKAGGPLHTTLMNTKSYGSISKIFICVPPPPVIIEMCLLKAIDDIDYSWTLTVHNSSVSETTASVVEEHLEDNIELVKVTTVTHKVYGHFNVNNPSFLCFPKLKDISVWIGTHQVTATCNPVWFGFILSKIVECDFSGSFTGDKPSDVKVEVKIDPKTTCVSDNTATTSITVWSPPCEEKDKCVSCVTVTSESKDVVIVNGIQKNICNPPNLGSIVARIPVLSVPRPCVVFTVKVGTCPSMTKSFCVSLPQRQQQRPLVGTITQSSATYTSRYVWDYTTIPQTGCISGEMCTQIPSPSLSSYFVVSNTGEEITDVTLGIMVSFFNPNDVPIHIVNVVGALGEYSFNHFCPEEDLASGQSVECFLNPPPGIMDHLPGDTTLHIQLITNPSWAEATMSTRVDWTETPIDHCVRVTYKTVSDLVFGLPFTQTVCGSVYTPPEGHVLVLVQQKEELSIPFQVSVEGTDPSTSHSDEFQMTFCGKIHQLVISAPTPIFSQKYLPPHWRITANPPSTCVASTSRERAQACLGQFVSHDSTVSTEPNWELLETFIVSNPDANCPAVIQFQGVSVLVDGQTPNLGCRDNASNYVDLPFVLPAGSFISCTYGAGGQGIPSKVEISVTVTSESLVDPPSSVTLEPVSNGQPPENSCVMIGLTEHSAVKWCNASSPLPCIPLNETFGENSTTDNTCFTYSVHVWSLDLRSEFSETIPFQFCFCPSCSCIHNFTWWTTHQDQWPWPEMATTPFFCSGKTWGKIAEITGKEAKLCYWKLAKLYLASRFGIMTGSCIPSTDVVDVFEYLGNAETYLNNNTVCQSLKCHSKIDPILRSDCSCGCSCSCFAGGDDPLALTYLLLGLYSEGGGRIPGAPSPCRS